VQQRQRPKSKRKKPANTRGIFAIAVCGAVALAVGAGPQTARALIVPTPAPSASVRNAIDNPNATVLPLDSSLFFVVDDAITSRLRPGSTVRAHLRDPILLAGKTIVPAGTPVQIQISQAVPARMGNEDGSVDIYFGPLAVPGGASIPLTTPTAHIDPHVSVGSYNTRSVTDTIGDIFIPGHYIYHMLRRGHDVVLGPGTLLRARTGASVSLVRGVAVVATPPPLVTAGDTPHPAFEPAPVYTPPGFHLPTPKPSPSPQPTSKP